jgi:hypothetical protein
MELWGIHFQRGKMEIDGKKFFLVFEDLDDTTFFDCNDI